MNTSGECLTCLSNEYFDGVDTCLTCPDHCNVCTETTGACTECTSPWVDDGNDGCTCPVNTFSIDDVCVNYVDCGSGYWNDGQNNCFECGLNCLTCADYDGSCTSCDNGGSVESDEP